MGFEGIERLPQLAGHVGAPLGVEQHEDLVELPPELAEPLHGEGGGRDHEGALGPAAAQQAGQDEAGLDGLAEADLVGQEPAHRIGGGRALGHVELVREELDASAQERAQAARLPHALEHEARPGGSRSGPAGSTSLRREALQGPGPSIGGPEATGLHLAAVREAESPGRPALRDGHRLVVRVEPGRGPRHEATRARAPVAGVEGETLAAAPEEEGDVAALDSSPRVPGRDRG